MVINCFLSVPAFPGICKPQNFLPIRSCPTSRLWRPTCCWKSLTNVILRDTADRVVPSFLSKRDKPPLLLHIWSTVQDFQASTVGSPLDRRSVQQSSQAAVFFSRYYCNSEVTWLAHNLRTRVSQIQMCIKCWNFLVTFYSSTMQNNFGFIRFRSITFYQ